MRVRIVDNIMSALSHMQAKTVSGTSADATHSDVTWRRSSLPGISRRDSDVPVTDSIAAKIGLAGDASHTQPASQLASYVRDDSRHSQDQERTDSFPTVSPSYPGEGAQIGPEVIQQDGTPTVHPDEPASLREGEGDCPSPTAAAAREPDSCTGHTDRTKDPFLIVTWVAAKRPEDSPDTGLHDTAELRYTRSSVTRK